MDDPARVIVIGSVDGIAVPPWESYAYSSSKAGLRHLIRHLARRLADSYVTVNATAPGTVPSRMTGPVLYDPQDEQLAATPLVGSIGPRTSLLRRSSSPHRGVRGSPARNSGSMVVTRIFFDQTWTSFC